ncbi:MAG: sugar phosphate isomerase/epimerase [Ruminococcaceae bacterium]|nr:sugar phosphate isomerase/epimerase [Oscillospiraceae bacterium]
MYKFPIGVLAESFRLPTREAVKRAAELGLNGLQLYSTKGENGPQNLSGKNARDLLNYVKDHGLVFSALCGDLGKGFGNPELNPELIDQSKRILELAKELECNIVTTHIGVVPEDPEHERYKIMQEACGKLAEFADSIDAHFAIETGPETSATLKKFLDSLHSTGVAVNLDPANLVMVTGDDPVQAVYNLKDYIVHTHAKDGRMLVRTNPEYIYRVVHPIPEEIQNQRLYEEVPLGTGSVDFPAYLAALSDIGYTGYLTIERECGEDPAGDIVTAANFLRGIIG